MVKIFTATITLLVMLYYSQVNAETCRPKDDLVNLTTMHFSICLAEYKIQHYTKSEVDYDLMKCGEKARLAMSKYFKLCTNAEYIIEATIGTYTLCKIYRTSKRVQEVEKGINNYDLSTDQEACELIIRNKH